MAFTATTTWRLQTGGSDTANGGGFDTGVTGFPTDGAATSANTSSPVFTSASYSFVAGDVGAWVYIKSGTNWIPGWYQIASVSGGAATLSGAIGAAYNTVYAPNTAAGCATTASPTAATWGIDYSNQASAQISFTDLVIGATTTQFTSAGNPVGKNFVGNIISITSGTGFTVQRVAIVSTSGTTATCDKSLGTAASTGGNGGLGGCLASPGQVGALWVGGNDCTWKSGTYTTTSTTANVSGGRVNLTPAGTSGTNLNRWVGYGTVPGDGGTKPVFKQGTGLNSVDMFAIASSNNWLENIEIDCSSNTNVGGFIINFGQLNTHVIRCRVRNATGTGNGAIGSKGGTMYVAECEVIGSGSAAAACYYGNSAMYCRDCVARDGACVGFYQVQTAVDCIASNNGNVANFQAGSTSVLFENCTAYGGSSITGTGFEMSSSPGAFVNCVAVNQTTGFNATTTNEMGYLRNCAGYNNTAPVSTNISKNEGFITLSGNPFTAAGSNDFSLNSTAGAGASLKAAGIPGVFPGGLSTGYKDIGAVQSNAGGGGGGSTTRAYGFAG